MSDNVISLKDFRPSVKEDKTSDTDFDFEAIAKQNAEKEQRLREERIRANKGVVRANKLNAKK